MQQRGDLDSAKFIDAEISQIESFKSHPGAMITAAVAEPTAAFGKVRSIYLAEIGKFESAVYKKLEPIVASQERVLKDLVIKLTRQGKLAEAELVNMELGKIGIAVCRVANGKYERLLNSKKAYSNREYVWIKVPDSLAGLDFNVTAGNVAREYKIEVLRPGLLHVAVSKDQSDEIARVLVAEGFKKSDLTFSHSPRGGNGMLVFSKYVVQGFRLPAVPNSFTGFVIIGNLR